MCACRPSSGLSAAAGSASCGSSTLTCCSPPRPPPPYGPSPLSSRRWTTSARSSESVSSEARAGDRVVRTAPNGVPLLQAPTLAGGVAHGFTTRQGGESPPPFDTLNLGRGVGDHPERVAANRQRALEAMGGDPEGHVEAAQVHGRTVRVVGRGQRGAKIDGADGLLTAEPGVTLAIHTADCVPILLWDPRRGAIGAVHAGWRGTAVGVAAAAVEEMTRSFETDPADLRVAMGPAVGPCHYEVDTPVAQAFGSWPWAA